MKLAHIKISNILGIEELELTPKGYTQISGPNGTGKTSVLEAIKAGLKTGTDATLLRRGAEHGEIVLVLDDGSQVRKSVTPSGASTTVLDTEGRRQKRPAEALSQLVDMMAVNPVEFLQASKRERAAVLLESMPIELDHERLQSISGVPLPENARNAIEAIDETRRTVYDERTGTNRAVKEKEATIDHLRAALPEPPGGIEGSEQDLQREIDAAQQALAAQLGELDARLARVTTKKRDEIDAIRQKLAEDIEALRTAAQFKIDEANAFMAEQERRASEKKAEMRETSTQQIQPTVTALETLRANRDTAARRAATMETITKLEADLTELRSDAERQTKALEAIDAYKAEILQSLPIPGLEVRDGEIYRDGIPLDRLNTAQQVQIAVDLAKLRAGPLGIACVDRIESLDKDAREHLRKGACAAGLQLFVTRVTDSGSFAVNTTG